MGFDHADRVKGERTPPHRSARAHPTVRSAGGGLKIPAGGHLCLYYASGSGVQLATMLPFIAQGLDEGERVIYVADDLSVFQLHAALASRQIDPLQQMARGALLLLTRSDWRLPGDFDAHAQVVRLREMIERALDAGFKGVRFGVEMTWTLGPTLDAWRLRRWETATHDMLASGAPARMICQYSRSRMAPEALRTALLTHPHAILADGLHANPFFGAQTAADGGDQEPVSVSGVDRMIARLASTPP